MIIFILLTATARMFSKGLPSRTRISANLSASKVPSHDRMDILKRHMERDPRVREMIAELEAQRRIIDDIIKEQPAMLDSYRSKILEIELMYCKIYLAVEDAPNLKKHLDEAAKFYTDDSFSSTVIAYNFSWAGYYYITKDWDKCFPQFELTLSAFKGTQPMYEMDIRRIMGVPPYNSRHPKAS